MTAKSGVAVQEIEELLADRQKYESWLHTLEARRAATPIHVHERVKSDYESRLQDVLDKLLGRASDVQKEIDRVANRLSKLQEDESQKRDQRAEAELRHSVGEYAPDQWKKLSEESDAEISRLATEREAAAGELERHQELLKSITARRSVAEPAVWKPEPPPPPPAPPPAAAPPPMPRVSAPRPRMETPAEPPPPVPSPPAPAAPRAQPPGGTFDELEFLKSVIEPRPDGGVGLRASGPRAAVQANPPAPPAPVPAAKPAASAGPASGATPAAPPPLPPPPSRSASPPAGVAPAGGAPAGGASPNAAAVPPLPPPPAPAAQPPAARGTAPGRRMTTSGPPASGGPAPAASPPSAAPGGATARPSDEAAARRRDSDRLPPFLKDVPSEQVKTLKCQECGTMNYPTEWYCERCGGELAAM